MARSVLAAAAALVTACGGSGSAGPRGSAPSGHAGPGAQLTGTIVVLAAASLTEPFRELGRRFEAAHPAASVSFSFDGSATLVEQVLAGAPADVLATADEATMQKALERGAVAAPAVIAHNRLAIAVARGNPRSVSSLADLRRPGLVVVLCAAEVPCGRAAAESLRRAGVQVQPRSLEPNVKAVMTKVALGEADAGVVYVSDVRGAAAGVEAVGIPPEHNVVSRPSLARPADAPTPAVAEAFIAFVRSPEGVGVLAAAGFET